ncbi:MAG TPA: ATP-binding protein [Actinocrinis sp.]|uniref:ATP-binding protein n=1 Tax=Actinocrinis sp. TaxID=1920516 RepID=UPI002DDD61EF|nr:ATP-binding protein [Actinocrinis sp.]HEV3169677.1 ATP-binding protein [Actinocrinis sp.]
MAGALGLVRGAALNLATGQAILRRNTNDSLVNLARRNQNLVRRQLVFITRLERDEPDAEVLASLFELDHLATRMRRNAESLLVLVGEAPARRWARPISVNDLILAAISEVEDYPGVALRRVNGAQVTGSVIAELAHLLAELIENGLHFSPSDMEVEILGRRTGDGYLIAAADHGVGMSPAALDRANAKLRGEEQFAANVSTWAITPP